MDEPLGISLRMIKCYDSQADLVLRRRDDWVTETLFQLIAADERDVPFATKLRDANAFLLERVNDRRP